MTPSMAVFEDAGLQFFAGAMPDRVGCHRTPKGRFEAGRSLRLLTPEAGVERDVGLAGECPSRAMGLDPTRAALGDIIRHALNKQAIPTTLEAPLQPTGAGRLADQPQEANGCQPVAQA